MKNLLTLLILLSLFSSCATSKLDRASRIELRNEKKLADQEQIKKAVESKRFIIKLDRLFYSRGGIIDLRPRANYIIVDGDKAIISAAYLGRQHDIRPIAGISMRGVTTSYKLNNDSIRGMYEINMEVSNGANSFDVYLKIGNNGSCSASLSNLKIDFTRYSGQIVPIRDKNRVPLNKNIMI